jgi:hypothetical protein
MQERGQLLFVSRLQVDFPFQRALMLCLLCGLAGTVAGCYQCVLGHIYHVAAEHEATAVGRVVGFYHGKGSMAYHFVFSVNEVAMDDYSEVCATPLTPGACDNRGPVLVYYSYQPYQNSLLEDFAVASRHAYRMSKFAFAIGLPCLVLSCVSMVILERKDKGKDSDPEDRKRTDIDSEMPDDLHIVPHD